jgi:hypothetical protein
MCTALLLVLGGSHLRPNNILPPEHGIQQVLQVHTHEVSTPMVCTLSVIASSIEVAES